MNSQAYPQRSNNRRPHASEALDLSLQSKDLGLLVLGSQSRLRAVHRARMRAICLSCAGEWELCTVGLFV